MFKLRASDSECPGRFWKEATGKGRCVAVTSPSAPSGRPSLVSPLSPVKMGRLPSATAQPMQASPSPGRVSLANGAFAWSFRAAGAGASAGWIKVEDHRLAFLASAAGQKKIRAENYADLRDHLAGQTSDVEVGRVINPATSRGSSSVQPQPCGRCPPRRSPSSLVRRERGEEARRPRGRQVCRPPHRQPQRCATLWDTPSA